MIVTVTKQNYYRYSSTVDIIPASGPHVTYNNHVINDAAGNNNGLVDFDEFIQLHTTLENVGSATANNVTATLICTDPIYTLSLIILKHFGTINAGASKTMNNAFGFYTADDVPDQYIVDFELQITGDADDTWTANFSILVNAPLFQVGSMAIDDNAGGNGDGRLDPGETANITIGSTNTGHTASSAAVATLTSGTAYITINTPTQNYASIGIGSTVYPTFSITVSGGTPTGTNVTLNYSIVSGNYSAIGSFGETIGQVPVLIINLDPTNNSAPAMQTALNGLGVSYETYTTFPADLDLYASTFVCLGIYSDNHVLTTAEGQTLADYMNNGGDVYMEGGDTWAYDTQTTAHAMFNIDGVADGSGDMSTIAGQAGTFALGMSFVYSGENNCMDQLNPISPAFLAFKTNHQFMELLWHMMLVDTRL